MKKIRFVLTLLLLVFGTFVFSFAQVSQAPAATRGYVVEVTYYKGRPFAYQRVGEWSWYGAFALVADWKLKPGNLPIHAVKLYPRDDAGMIKVKVTVLRGDNLEVEDFVAEYSVGEKKTVIEELTNFGILPFELKLVRAPSTVADLPVINNDTKSLVVGVEPVSSSLPSFKATFVNSSAKPVMGFAYRTSINRATKLSGMPKDRQGGTLIAPGATYNLTLRYPMVLTTESTGEVPSAQAGLQFNILAVMFADGSYEGDRVQAARFRGFKLGEKIQLMRILNLLRSTSAATADALAVKSAELTYRIGSADVSELAAEFPGLTEAEIENLRSAAEASSSDIQKSFTSSFGKGTSSDPKTFSDAVKEAILKYEKWLDSLP